MYRLVYIFLLSSVSSPSLASLSPKHYQLECGQYFDCPQALQRRVHFWIDIFGRYSTDTAVFHDRDEPEKVYSALERPGACGGRSTPKAIDKERKRIKMLLHSIAAKKTKHTQLTKQEKQLASLFTNQSPSKIRKASERIRCQSGNSTRFRKAVKRFGSHRAQVSSALKEYGLPEGIQYLPFVESAYSPSNYSRVGAAGLWQLMPATASHLGLLVNPVIDERMDPEISTLGAIKYLQHSFEVLAPAARALNPEVTEANIYPFVMTSYNFGLSGMLRAMNEEGVDFVKVLENYKSSSFQVAVKNFYASFLAARHVATHADQFFSLLPENKPLKTVTARNNKARSASAIVRHFGLKIDTLRTHNPALRSAVWKGQHLIPKGFQLRIPVNTKGNLNRKITQLNKLAANKPPKKQRYYRVRKGDSACGIAQRYKVSCKQLVRTNRLGKKAVVRIGKTLTIPGGSVVLQKSVTAPRSRIFGKHQFSAKAIMATQIKTIRSADKRYTVAKGDTTCQIAERHQMSCRELMQVNTISSAGKITIGETLRIPGKTKNVVGKIAVADKSAEQNNGVQNTSLQETPEPNQPDSQILANISSDTSYLDRFLGFISFNKQPITKAAPISVAQNQQVDTFISSSLVNNKPEITPPKPDTVRRVQQALVKQPSKNNAVVITAANNHQPQKQFVNSEQMEKMLSANSIAHSFGATKDFRVSVKKATGWTIQVATDETLGHYADWLDIGFSKPILKLNGIKSSRSVWIGKTIRLPIKDKATKKRFEAKRIAYHRNLQKHYFDQYAVTGKKQYRFQSGDNPWTIASAHQIPLWLLKRFNPGIFKNQHDIGNVVVLPVLELHQS